MVGKVLIPESVLIKIQSRLHLTQLGFWIRFFFFEFALFYIQNFWGCSW